MKSTFKDLFSVISTAAFIKNVKEQIQIINNQFKIVGMTDLVKGWLIDAMQYVFCLAE